MHLFSKTALSFVFAFWTGMAGVAHADVGSVAATPAVTTVNTASGYTVDFRTSNSGALTLLSTIHITFPDNTLLPVSYPGDAGGQITVNGTTATATSFGPTLVISVPRDDIDRNTDVTVLIAAGVENIINPSIPGTYQVLVHTSSETTDVASPNYTLQASATSLSVGNVSLTPATLGNTATCSFDITLAADGALWGGHSQIVITFPAGTGVRNGAITGVTVDGTPVDSATGNATARTITLVPNQDVANSATVTVSLPASALRNPTTAGSYSLTCSTSAQPVGSSPSYTITTSGTAVNVVSVVPSPITVSNYAQYAIDFNTAADGGLVGSVSDIVVTFPAGYTIANGAIANVTVEGVAAFSATGNSGSRTITIKPSQDIYGGVSNITVFIPSAGSAVRNPASSGNYTLTVSTTVQPSAGTSPEFAIGTSSTTVNIDSVTLGSSVVGNASQYDIQIDLAADGGMPAGTGSITIVFPSNTAVDDGGIAGVTVEGTNATSALGNSATRTITVVPAQTLNGSASNINVVIPSTALNNPTIAGNYTLTVQTSVQPVGTSPQYTIGLSATSVNIDSVVINPITVGNPSQYNIQIDIAADGGLTAGVDAIIVTFPSNTVVVDGAFAGVTIEGNAASSATGNSGARTITVVPGTSLAGSASNQNIIIPSTALTNPTTAANYQLTVRTSKQPSGTSPNYTVGMSSAMVSVGSVSVNPAVINNPAQYTIDFNTSSDGGLVGGVSQIVVTFPVGTAVTNGSLAGVTVEGTAAFSATGNSASRTITIVPDQNIAGGTANITLIIPSSAVRNPGTANNYTLSVATSAQPAGTSPQYTIGASSTNVVVGTVVPSPTVAGQPAQYTIPFNTSSDGYLVGGTSQIVVAFPLDTQVTNGPIGSVTVGGLAATSATGNSGARTITIVPSQNIAGGSANVTIVIPFAGLRNPSTTGNYTLTVATSPQPAGTSPAYTIGQSTTPVAFGSVVPSPSTIGNQAQYTINFNTSSDGALVGGSSQIIITFPADTQVTNGAILGVTVEGSAAFSATGDSGNRRITVVPTADIAGSFTNVTVVIPTSAVRNPTTAGDYALTVRTSVQPVGTSPTYAIGLSSTSVVITSVTPSPSTVGNQGQYTIDFNTSSDGALSGGSSQIVVTFPSNTAVTDGPLAGVTVEGLAATSATGNAGSRTVTIVPSQSFNASTNAITIVIPSTAVRNPTSAGSYTLTVRTSVQPNGTSPNYTIGQSTSVVNVSGVTPNPATVGNPAQYTIAFTTSSDGALLAGTSTITVVFPANTAVFNGAIAGVTVNTVGATASGNSATRTITITAPAAIAGSAAVTVVIPSSALTNPTTQGNYSLTAATSAQPAGTSPLYAIGLSSTMIVVTSAVPSPSVVGNQAAYTIDFSTSADGAIPGGSGSIIVTFPVDTLVGSGAIAGVTVEGMAATSATGDGNRTITIVPQQTINANSTDVTIYIPAAVPGVRNPTTAGSYTLQVASSVQGNGTSPAYTISASTTPVAVNSVTPNPTTVGSDAAYSIQITTSSDAPLFTGGQIVITFPVNTYVAAGAIAGVTVNGGAVTSATGNSGSRTVTIVLASGISAGSVVTLAIPSTALHNPTNAGNYTLTVSTSAQPAGTSPAYTITLGGPLTVNSVAVVPTVVNTLAAYTVGITPTVVLRGNSSAIFLSFPAYTQVPASLTGVTVGGVPAASVICSPASRLVTIFPATDVTPSGLVSIAIPNAEIGNSSIPGSQLMSVSTTAQPANTQTFTLTPSSTLISTPAVSVSPSQAGAVGEYTITFNVGTRGRLNPGNRIAFQFPAATILPGALPAGTITVNGVGNTGAVYAVGQMVQVVVPTGVAVANSGAVTVVFLASAGVINPNVGQVRMEDVHTDAEPGAVPSTYYYITATTTITSPVVTVSPNSINTLAQYQIVFRLGASGSLAAGKDSIFLIFPNEVTLPSQVIASRITVNGTPVTAMRKLSSVALELASPVNILAGAPDKTVTILIQTSFAIMNPVLPGDYRLTAYTAIENTPIQSQPFTIMPSTTTQITAPALDLYPAFTNSFARYRIQFTTGALGGLAANLSTISIAFPNGFVLPASIEASMILVNNQALAAAPVINGQILTLTTPATIASAGAVTIEIQSTTRIQNPGMEDNYSLTLWTSSESNQVASNAVFIRRSTWDDVVGYPNPLKYDQSFHKAFVFTFVPDRTATLKLYSLDGRLVKTVVKDDATDRIVWNLNNERGQIVASGIYIYLIQGASGEKRGKIAFLK